MLVEVKVKTSRNVDNKVRKKTETFIVPDCELFVNAEHSVMSLLAEDQSSGLLNSFEILSLKQSAIKEVCTQWLNDYVNEGYPPFVATLKDIYLGDDGSEKPMRYKVLLWARNHEQALSRVNELARQGYDMRVESIKQVEYEYIIEENE